jgi:hypothetical protein
MLGFLFDNLVFFWQKTVDISLDTNCDPFLADLFLYSQEVIFIQGVLQKWKEASPIL